MIDSAGNQIKDIISLMAQCDCNSTGGCHKCNPFKIGVDISNNDSTEIITQEEQANFYKKAFGLNT